MAFPGAGGVAVIRLTRASVLLIFAAAAALAQLAGLAAALLAAPV